MKNLITLIISIHFSLFTIHSYGQWEWQNPLPQGNNLTDVHFIDNDHGWAVGKWGTLLTTNDGAASWETVNTGMTNHITDIWLEDTLNAWAIATTISNYNPYAYGRGFILHTSDGGQSWNEQFSDTNLSVKDFFFLDSENAWAIGYHDILHTNDGGEHWELLYSDTTSNWGYKTIFFVDFNYGWVIRFRDILCTTDGGNSWDTLYSFPHTINDVFFIDQNHGWVTGNNYPYYGIIWHTNDGGISWVVQNDSTTGEFYDIQFIDHNLGWAMSGNNILRTNDGGVTWQDSIMPWKSLSSIHFVSPDTGYTVGDKGVIMHSYDGGSQWEEEFDGITDYFSCIDFIDLENGWAVGGNHILHTSDGGLTWELQNSGTGQSLKSICFVDQNYGWAVGYFGVILHTSDGGNTWIIQDSIVPGLNSVCFVDQNFGWAGGAGIIHTSDGGENWIIQSGESINDVCFVDQNNGWAVRGYGSNPFYGIIYHTSDGGNTWEVQMNTYDAALRAVSFADQYNGLAVGDGFGDYIYHTTDGGETWNLYIRESAYWLSDVVFIDPETAWIVGGYTFSGSLGGGIIRMDHIILLTNDGCNTWQVQHFQGDIRLTSVDFIDEHNGWAAGIRGAIIHTGNGGGVGVKEIPNPSIFTDNCLYPNPVSSVARLRLTITDYRLTICDLYGIDGRRIRKLINQEMPAGEHEIEIDVSDLPVGVYFVRVQDGKNVAVAKVLVVH